MASAICSSATDSGLSRVTDRSPGPARHPGSVPVRVVALNGSPHPQGNTVALMEWVVEGCLEAGATVEWLHAAGLDIRYCRGCMSCLRDGECPIGDGFAATTFWRPTPSSWGLRSTVAARRSS